MNTMNQEKEKIKGISLFVFDERKGNFHNCGIR